MKDLAHFATLAAAGLAIVIVGAILLAVIATRAPKIRRMLRRRTRR